MFDGNFRTGFEKSVAPVGARLQKAGVSPDAITAVGVARPSAHGHAITSTAMALSNEKDRGSSSPH